MHFWVVFSRAFSGRGLCHFYRGDIGMVEFKIAENGIKCTHGTGNAFDFLFNKREVYDMIAWTLNKWFWQNQKKYYYLTGNPPLYYKTFLNHNWESIGWLHMLLDCLLLFPVVYHFTAHLLKTIKTSIYFIMCLTCFTCLTCYHVLVPFFREPIDYHFFKMA